MQPFQGKSLLKLIKSFNGSSAENFVLLGRERQDVGRPNDEGYPVRAIVKGNFIYSKNYEPNRWPAGDPVTGYMDTELGRYFSNAAQLDANKTGGWA